MRNLVRSFFLAAASVLAAGVAIGPAVAAQDDFSRVERAVAKYQDAGRALADGYVNLGECVSGPPGQGAMGIHFLHPQRSRAATPNLEEPPVLLYEPTDSGLKLVAVEWLVGIGAPGADVPQSPPPPPRLMGQAFEGPMKGHNANMPPHYDLHAWFDNPAGRFADFNTNVSCPE